MKSMIIETEAGLHTEVIDPSYNFSCGPYKMSVVAMLTPYEALQYARSLGKKIRLAYDGLVVWYGFITDISCDAFTSKVGDIKNHLLSSENPTITDQQSVDNHGPLSASYDDDNTDISILSKPVLRTSSTPSQLGNSKVRVRINAEGPMLRLNRIIYSNSDEIVASSGGIIKIGQDEDDQIITQYLELPFDSNFISISWTTEGTPTGAVFQVLNSSFVPIITQVLNPSDNYYSTYYPTVLSGNGFYLRVSYFGVDSYNIGLGVYSNVQSATADTTGTLDYSMSVNVRLNTTLSDVCSNIMSYIQGITNGSDMVKIYADDETSFIDSAFIKIGDYLTNLSLLRNMTMIFEVNQWDYYLWISSVSDLSVFDATRCYNYIVPMMQRSTCSSVVGDDRFQGFIISDWYGTIQYSEKTGRIKYS